MVAADSALPLPWLAAPLRAVLDAPRAHHATLIHGGEGAGQFELATTLAQAWLCEATTPMRPCGTCPSCRLAQAHSHPDMLVLVPEALQEALGWSRADEDAAPPKSDRKPSKEIKVEAVRQAVNFAQLTSARGRAKVVVLYPAERMNMVSANTLLKTLEEPPGLARFVLASGSPQDLPATVRSRCQLLHLAPPSRDEALRWLVDAGVPQADVLLAAVGGMPLLAKAWFDDGITAEQWSRLPLEVAAGRVGPLASWPVPRMVDALQKLCHDAMLAHVGMPPRYFAKLSKPRQPAALLAWARVLTQTARHAEHPVNAGLLVESLVLQGRRAWAVDAVPRGPSIHSAA